MLCVKEPLPQSSRRDPSILEVDVPEHTLDMVCEFGIRFPAITHDYPIESPRQNLHQN